MRWDRMLELASWHRMLPLLRRHLDRAGLREVVPAEAQASLDDAYERTAAQNVWYRHELARVTDLFRGAGLPVMALKGLVLLEEVFPNLALRPMSDIDLLVPADSFERAGELLEGDGYRGYEGYRARLGAPGRCGFIRDDGPGSVDLHYLLLERAPRFDIDQVWVRARPSRLGDYLIPHPDDLLLHLGVHFAVHRGVSSVGALGQLADLVWVSDRLDIDWDSVIDQARRFAVSGRLFLALASARAVLGWTPPTGIVESLTPAAADELSVQRFIERRVLDTRPWHIPGYFSRLPREMFSAGGRPFARLLPSRAYLRRQHGADGEDPSYLRLYFRRILAAISNARTRELVETERLHAWMRRLDVS